MYDGEEEDVDIDVYEGGLQDPAVEEAAVEAYGRSLALGLDGGSG